MARKKPEDFKIETTTGPAPIVEPKTKPIPGGVSADGKNYPTTNPNFVPNPQETTQLKFNKDGSVAVSPKGSTESITLTADEYKQTLGPRNVPQVGTAPTPNLEALRQAQNPDLSSLNKPITPSLENPANIGDKVTTGVLGAGAIAGGVASGAGIGAVVGGPVGAVIGGALGGAGAFIGKLSLDARQNTKVSKANFDNAKGSMNALISLATTNPELREQAIQQWNDNRLIIRDAEEALKKQNKNIVGKKLASNLDELADIEQFNRDYALLYEAKFRQALGIV